METITKYKTDDGREFLDCESCVEHEANCKEAAFIIGELPERPSNNGCDFENGGGYIQHDEEIFMSVKAAFLEFSKRYTDHKWIQSAIDKPETHSSWPARILSEAMPSSIYRHWHRFECTDKDFCEWGQPYYATHQNEAKQIQLN